MPEIIMVGFRHERRLFTDKAAAERYEHIELPRLKAEKAEKRKLVRKERQAPKQPESAKAAAPGVHIPRYTGQKFDKHAPAVRPAHVKVQKLPGHPGYDARYTLPPGTKMRGDFSNLPLGATLMGMLA
jgi:hypothetical protein